MRPEAAFLRDITVAAGKIQRLTESVSLETLLEDDTVQAAILYHLVVIGEAMNNFPRDLLDRHQEVPWRAVIALRNRVIHGYFGIDWNLLRPILMEHVPSLKEMISRILKEDFGDPFTGM